MMLLEDRHVLLTGAARGIGLAAAQACLDQGATLTLTDMDADALHVAKDMLGAASERVRTAQMDVTDAASVERVMADLGGRAIDALINNAAMLDISNSATVALDRWNTVLDVNLTGALRVTQAALPMLRKSTAPSIVNTISTQAFWGVQDSVAYASAKGGLMMLTRSMAVDFGAEGIRVNAVAPGFIDTRMALADDGSHEHEDPLFRDFYLGARRIPLARAGNPQDCAGAFVFLASSMSLYVTGQAICVDGGLSATY